MFAIHDHLDKTFMPHFAYTLKLLGKPFSAASCRLAFAAYLSIPCIRMQSITNASYVFTTLHKMLTRRAHVRMLRSVGDIIERSIGNTRARGIEPTLAHMTTQWNFRCIKYVRRATNISSTCKTSIVVIAPGSTQIQRKPQKRCVWRVALLLQISRTSFQVFP